MMEALKQRSRKIARYLGIHDPEVALQVILRLILITLCIGAYPQSQYLQWLFIPGIVLPRVITNSTYWLIISLVFGLFCLCFGIRYAIDNHVYLFAILLVLGAVTVRFHNKGKDWAEYLAFNARAIVGLVFLFATFGKLISAEFTDSSFTEFLLTLDDRFKGFTTLLLRGNDSILTENRAVLESLKTTNSLLTGHYPIQSTPVLSNVALFMTWWTVIIEGALAILYLLPDRLSITRYRDTAMIIFILTTYPIATVSGFARVLLTLAFTSSTLHNRKEQNYVFPLIYLLTFCAFFIFSFHFVRFFKLAF